MTYADSTIWWAQLHRQDRRTGVIVAVSVHAVLFLIGSAVFVKNAQYGVQTVSESVEVSLVEPPQETPVEVAQTPQPAQEEKKEVVKPQQQVIQGVKVEANPNYFQNPPPPYPELAKQMRQEGLVVLAVDVDRYGVPVKVDIQQSCGYRLLDQAALKAVSHWKFQPGRIGDLPVESKVTVPVRFQLEINQ